MPNAHGQNISLSLQCKCVCIWIYKCNIKLSYFIDCNTKIAVKKRNNVIMVMEIKWFILIAHPWWTSSIMVYVKNNLLSKNLLAWSLSKFLHTCFWPFSFLPSDSVLKIITYEEISHSHVWKRYCVYAVSS